MCISLVLLAASLVALGLGFVWIRISYLRYCAEADRIDFLRKTVSENESRLRDILAAFDREFGEGISGTISHNVRTKVDFSMSAIRTLTLEDQARETERLFKMTYETWVRATRNPDDVPSIVSPLNMFCKEIARRKIEILKDLSAPGES